jgi:hypothetical protein
MAHRRRSNKKRNRQRIASHAKRLKRQTTSDPEQQGRSTLHALAAYFFLGRSFPLRV